MAGLSCGVGGTVVFVGVDGIVMAGGDFPDAGAVVAGLHLHLVDVRAGQLAAGVMALEDGVGEDGVAAHHGAVVELGV